MAVVRQADILVTTTAAFEPVVKADWLHAGLHINAMGADTLGKQELETGLLARAHVVVAGYVWRQAIAAGIKNDNV